VPIAHAPAAQLIFEEATLSAFFYAFHQARALRSRRRTDLRRIGTRGRFRFVRLRARTTLRTLAPYSQVIKLGPQSANLTISLP